MSATVEQVKHYEREAAVAELIAAVAFAELVHYTPGAQARLSAALANPALHAIKPKEPLT